jgi:hypothetical protein
MVDSSGLWAPKPRGVMIEDVVLKRRQLIVVVEDRDMGSNFCR